MDSRLFALLRDFLALKPTKLLKFPSDVLPAHLNDFFVNDILLSQHFQQYPPSHQYQKRFWKWAIESLEDLARNLDGPEHDDFEIDSEIYTHYLSLIPPAEPTTGSSDPATRSQICGKGIPLQEAPPSQSYITHFWDMSDPSTEPLTSTSHVDIKKYHIATLLESRTTIESGTTGLRTWMGSFVLSQYLILHPELIVSKRILELGAGIGFLGIIVVSLQRLHETQQLPIGSKHDGSLWLTDINDEVLLRCRDNVKLPCNISASNTSINYAKLDWADSLEDRTHPSSLALATLLQTKIDPELILGADVVFDPTLIPALVSTLKFALQPRHLFAARKSALIALTIRNEETLDRFMTHVRGASLHIEGLEIGFNDISFSETVEAHNSCQDVKLFRITLAEVGLSPN